MKRYEKIKGNSYLKVASVLTTIGAFLVLIALRQVIGAGILLAISVVLAILSADKKKLVTKPLPREHREFILRPSPYYPLLSEKDRLRFDNDVITFLSELNFFGSEGKPLKFETGLFIVMGLATLLIGHPDWELPIPKDIVVLPGDRFNEELESGKGVWAALAHEDKLILTEKNVNYSFKHNGDAYNNIYHEIAHYFDTENQAFDGVPALHRMPSRHKAAKSYQEWDTVINEEFQKNKLGKSFFRAYAFTNTGELFACAVECFFEQPGKFRAKSPAFYKLLQAFFNLDTATLLESAPAQEGVINRRGMPPMETL